MYMMMGNLAPPLAFVLLLCDGVRAVTFRSSVLWTPYALALQPAHRWKLDEAVSATVAQDDVAASVATVAGSLQGSAVFVGPADASGVALPNDAGQNSYVSLGDAFRFDGTEGFSFAAHLRVDSLQKYAKIFSLWDRHSHSEIYLEMYDNTRQAVLSVRNGGHLGQLYTKHAFFSPPGEWAHVAVTVSQAGDQKLYLNGATLESTECAGVTPKICDGWTLDAADGGVAPNPNNVTYHAGLGRQEHYTGRDYFDGVLRDVFVYAGVLSGDQIQRLITYTTCPRLNFGASSPHTGKDCERMSEMSKGYYTCEFMTRSGYYCGGFPCEERTE